MEIFLCNKLIIAVKPTIHQSQLYYWESFKITDHKNSENYCIPRRHRLLGQTAKPTLSNFNPNFKPNFNPACGVSEIGNGEDLWQWSLLEIRLNAFRWSTIPQKQFIIIIIIIIIMIRPKNLDNISQIESWLFTLVPYKRCKCRGKYAAELIPVKDYKKGLGPFVANTLKDITKHSLKLGKMLLK